MTHLLGCPICGDTRNYTCRVEDYGKTRKGECHSCGAQWLNVRLQAASLVCITRKPNRTPQKA